MLGHMVYTAIQMISAGKGLETYRTFWLVNFNWYGGNPPEKSVRHK